MAQVGSSEVLRTITGVDPYSASVGNGVNTKFMHGLDVVQSSTNQITITPGAIYSNEAINAATSTASGTMQKIVKQYHTPYPSVFSVSRPSTSGQAVNYLVQARLVDLVSSEMQDPPAGIDSATGQIRYPFQDGNNALLPSLLLNGGLQISLKAGVAATAGTQTTPAVDSGRFPLYVITVPNGTASITVTSAAYPTPTAVGAPFRARLNATPTVAYPTSNPATKTVINGVDLATFGANNNTVTFKVDLASVNPYLPIKVKLLVSSAGTTGTTTMQLSYVALKEGQSTASVTATSASYAVPAAGTANTLYTSELSVSIPPAAFAGFDPWDTTEGYWKVNAAKIYASLSRTSATNTSSLVVHEVLLYQ
jgi:hypothetical protein